jgi:hypothetical protein
MLESVVVSSSEMKTAFLPIWPGASYRYCGLALNENPEALNSGGSPQKNENESYRFVATVA